MSRCISMLAVAGALAAGAAWGAEPPHDIWLLSTRCAPHCCCEDATLDKIAYWRLGENNDWLPADKETFKADDDAAVPTVVFVHGNWTDPDEAVSKAWYTYQVIRSQSGCQRFRYVIWSWPASRECRNRRADIQQKVDYCDIESHYLARWLSELKPGRKLSLTGHSFGPRIMAGALQLLAGGEVGGCSLPQSTAAEWKDGKRNPVRVMMLAAAIDSDWLAPGGCYGLALSLVERMLVTCNDSDRVLRRYSRLYGRGGPEAIGFVGPEGVAGFRNVEVVGVQSRRHDWRCYVSAPSVCGRWAEYTFLE